MATIEGELDAFGHVRLAGVGDRLAQEIEKRTGNESRSVVLGHLQRGGTPTAFDRWLATRFGLHAIQAVHDGAFGTMMALRGTDIARVPLIEGTGELKTVRPSQYAEAESPVRLTPIKPDSRRPRSTPTTAVRFDDHPDAGATCMRSVQPSSPQWPDQGELDSAVSDAAVDAAAGLRRRVRRPQGHLAEVAAGRAFLLQGGDCAETFDGVTAESVRAKLQVLLQMAVVLTYAASVPVVKLGRIAGPVRQAALERHRDPRGRHVARLPWRRGQRLQLHRRQSRARPAAARAGLQLVGGHPQPLPCLPPRWLRRPAPDARLERRLRQDAARSAPPTRSCRARSTGRSTSCSAIGAESEELHRVSFHSSHEALILEYEHALTRIDSRTDQPYDVSGHFVWIGERTRQLDGAHIEFASRIRNPIGVKLGPTTTADDALALAAKLNPDNEPGRLTFITRMSAGKIRDLLPTLVEKVTAAGVEVAWVCDPMHGNTFETSTGYKTRSFDDVIDEVRGFFEVHRALGTWPGGLHVELTGDDVTECVGGGEALDEHSARSTATSPSATPASTAPSRSNLLFSSPKCSHEVAVRPGGVWLPCSSLAGRTQASRLLA